MTEKPPSSRAEIDRLPIEDQRHRPGRRNFLKISAASATTASWLNPSSAFAERADPSVERDTTIKTTQSVSLNVNGVTRVLDLPANAVLLDVLRDRMQLIGTKKGCDHGQCGACTVHVNGKAINSCLSVAIQHESDRITTIEGLTRNGNLHPVQEAFWEHDAYQCGYCTSGQIMNAVSILNDPRIGADDASVREAMSGNICRCAAYKNILTAIQSARAKTKEWGDA
jgi:xanthine dehydrogenase YagT iron-sulfur-binding subunit